MNIPESKTLWLIPARKGSKGIPGKNLKSFCGKSLVTRAIELALQTKDSQDLIFVSTDSDEIRQEAEKSGIDIPFMRPPELATDSSSTYDVIIHTLKEFKKRGIEFERVVLLQPTSPLRIKEDVGNALNLWKPGIDMVVSVCEAKTNPYYNGFEIDRQGFLHISKGSGTYIRRQDAPKVWEYNGAVYVMSVESLLAGPISGFNKILPSPMPPERSLDLDTPVDWIIAEHIYRLQENNSQAFYS